MTLICRAWIKAVPFIVRCGFSLGKVKFPKVGFSLGKSPCRMLTAEFVIDWNLAIFYLPS